GLVARLMGATATSKVPRWKPPYSEIVPLLSGVVAGGCDLPFGRFSPFERPDGQEVVHQHAQPGLDPHPLQAPATESTQVPVLLGVREPQLHRLAPLAVDRLGLGCRHL